MEAVTICRMIVWAELFS